MAVLILIIIMGILGLIGNLLDKIDPPEDYKKNND
jgi:hypothetical protein